MVSNGGRVSACSLNICRSHQSHSASSCSGIALTNPIGDNSWNHSCLVTTQTEEQMILGQRLAAQDTLVVVLGTRPCLLGRSAVHRRRCSASQKKNFTLGGALVDHSSFASRSVVDPSKKAL
jgi:hypothetical protein